MSEINCIVVVVELGAESQSIVMARSLLLY